jgi:hypothetical protein
MQPTLAKELVIVALQMVVRMRQPASGLLHHSDPGSQADPMSSHRQVCMPVQGLKIWWKATKKCKKYEQKS